MDHQLLIQLLQNKTEEIQSLLEHFKNHPKDLQTNIRLLSDRIDALSKEFEVLKSNVSSPEIPLEKTQVPQEVKQEVVVAPKVEDEHETFVPTDAEQSACQEEEKQHQEAQAILNDQLHNQDKAIIGEKLSAHQLTDIQSAIGINDKFLFIRELFDNNADNYTRSIEFINCANNIREVENHFKETMNWDFEDPTVVQFMELSKRKF